ncbi:GNAT family N-acetyltransferase [Desulfosporosinus sp. SB140]|uniref:GNAT family N-acetyltransferase n=1 Tax=Desulfosporosinus paludis TaxID=3115649 RepID=UPI0038905F91
MNRLTKTLENNTNLFHNLEGKDISFQALEMNDVQEIHNYASDENVSRFIGWQLMKTVNETHSHIEEMLKRESAGTHLYASIVLKLTQEVIGTAMIFNFDHEANHVEIGYVFHSSHWGQGYGTEAVALMAEFAFDSLNLHKLHAQVVEANLGSLRVLEKNGFKLEGRLKDYYFIDGSYYDKILLGKFRSK